ncbi:YbhB/YbcL family Raf kinase inhibitor-like protein [Pendulispora rubella]|uniref:YbhB/YbcL family Raf kinase inhibitor-like protein n=1 Tax=Pendulispora rubella TaxID=2741070 RepID=A0ABZ2L1R1_9BACT
MDHDPHGLAIQQIALISQFACSISIYRRQPWRCALLRLTYPLAGYVGRPWLCTIADFEDGAPMRTIFPTLGFFAMVVGGFGCADDSPSQSGAASLCTDSGTSPSDFEAGTGGLTSVDNAPLGPTANVEITGHIFKPEPLPAPDVSKITVPAGFVLTKVAEKLGNARLIVVAKNGTIYITRREQGDVLMLKDAGDGQLAAPVRVASRSGLHGLALYENKAYLATPHEIFRGEVLADGTFGPLEMLIHDLPDAGQHNTRTLQIGPDAMLYVSIGSTCNECNEPNRENASILRASLDGKSRAIWASGLRDTIGWGWHPQTGELWGFDHGIDWLGDDLQKEELNEIQRGNHYGWPYFFGNNQVNPHADPPGGLSKAERRKVSTPMVLGYTAHAAPMQMSFYDGPQFPAEYRGDAFVSMRGSWNRKPPSGYEIVRVHFQDGRPRSITPFVTGFVGREGEYGRLCGNAVAKDGSLLFTDDRNGVLYRLSFNGMPNGKPASIIPAGPMLAQAARGSGVPLAIERPETATAATLTVTSRAFANGGLIPVVHSEYEQGASFPVAWTAGPVGTQSYVLIMEDPDATTPKPYVHWIAWNIPATATSLREGLQEQDVLLDPPNLRQGTTSGGTIGYRGPRPLAGDPPHVYHVQVFAMDRLLDVPLSGADRDQVLSAMNGHVLARGQLMGAFARPPTQVSRP